jgi:hypothetical protein
MKDQHELISGNKDLDQDTTDLLNRIQAHGEETRKLVEAVQARTAKQYNAARGDEELQGVAVDAMGWEEEGKRHLQTGFMFLTRAVAQPSSFA